VLVIDVTATNPTTHKSLTLDGDFGMNYLVTSADANLSKDHIGDFTWERMTRKGNSRPSISWREGNCEWLDRRNGVQRHQRRRITSIN